MTLDAQILKALRAAGDESVSGTDLAEQMGVSRAAVWARVEELRELCRQINRLAENSDKPAFKTRHGIPLSRNDGVKMTAEEVAATLSD